MLNAAELDVGAARQEVGLMDTYRNRVEWAVRALKADTDAAIETVARLGGGDCAAASARLDELCSRFKNASDQLHASLGAEASGRTLGKQLMRKSRSSASANSTPSQHTLPDEDSGQFRLAGASGNS